MAARRPKGTGSISETAAGKFRPSYKPDSSSPRVYLGSFDTEREAAEALDSHFALGQGAAKTPAERRARTFRAAIEKAIAADETLGAISEAKAHRTRWITDGYLTESGLADRQISEISPAHIQAVYSWLAKKGLGESTVKTARAAINFGLSFAVSAQWIPLNPATGAKYRPPKTSYLETERKPSSELAHQRRFSPAESAAFLKAIEGHRLYARWLLQFRWGLRPGEVLGLVDGDWNPRRRELRIERQLVEIQTGGGGLKITPLKTSQSARTLTLDRECAEAIDAWILARNAEIFYALALREIVMGQRRTFLFTQPPVGRLMKPVSPSSDEGDFSRIAAAAKLERVTRYTLRHNALSVIAEHVSIAVAAKIAGHRDISMMVKFYYHASDSEVAAVAQIWDSEQKS